MAAADELLIKLKTIAELGGFDALEGKMKKSQEVMNGMENTTNAASKKMKTDLEQVNNTNFSSLNNKFTSTISSMTSTASSGAKAIKNSLTSMVDGIDGAITTAAAGMGVMELFEKAMGKALTQTQLKNAKPQDYNNIMGQYQTFTTKSSASDDDINKMLRYTFSGNSNQTYRSLNAIDAVSYSADKLQRQEGIRGWGTYLSGGWTAASGMMRDEPLTADQQKLLQNAKTYDERVSAMETIAQQKGNVDKFGNSLSTTVDGPLGKYNQALAAEDTIVRGATSSFETLMTWIAPVIDGFTKLDPNLQSLIGTGLTLGIVLTAGAAGLGILIKVLSPVYDGFKKVKDALSGAKDIKDKITGLKDSLDGKKLTSSVTIKATNVYVSGKTTGTSSTSTTTTTPTKTDNTGKGITIGSLLTGAGWLSLGAAGMTGVGGFGGMIKDEMLKYFPSNWGQSAAASTTGIQKQSGLFGWGTLSGEGVGRTIWGMLNGQDFGTASGNAVQTMYSQSQQPKGPGPAGQWLQGAGSNVQSWANDNIGKPLNDWWGSWSLDSVGKSADDWFKNATPSQSIMDWANTNLGKPVTDAWNSAKTTVMNTPVLGSAITAVDNLLTDPKKAWNDARNWVLSNPTIGKAWADAYALYSNVKTWWDKARAYVRSHTISAPADQSEFNGGGGGGAFDNNTAGDEGADAGYGQGPYYEPIITTPTNTTTKKVTIAPVIKIDSINSKDDVDYLSQKITQILSDLNDANGN